LKLKVGGGHGADGDDTSADTGRSTAAAHGGEDGKQQDAMDNLAADAMVHLFSLLFSLLSCCCVVVFSPLALAFRTFVALVIGPLPLPYGVGPT
jgi:hypothetical protein